MNPVTIWLCKARQAMDKSAALSLRSPVRPNPIDTSIVNFVALEDHTILVSGLDCLAGTPVLDIKPDRTLFTPIALPRPGDLEVGDKSAV